MPCFHPLEAWRGPKNPSGKRGIVFQASGGFGSPIQIPCGQCIGCRLMRAQDWAVRCVHEAQFHAENSFLTLTYAEEHRPADGSVSPADLSDFIRRLRRHLFPKRVRFLGCGEYGDRTWRPHYHVLLFGHEFLEDRVPYRETPYGRTYKSQELDAIWGLGLCEIGSLTSQSAAYVARYSMKKIRGDLAESHYFRPDPDTGELRHLRPEFLAMSKQPGIGYEWFKRFAPDLREDFAVVLSNDGAKKHTVPKYYDKLFDERERERRKAERKRKARLHRADQTPARLAVREAVTVAKQKFKLTRGDPE